MWIRKTDLEIREDKIAEKTFYKGNRFKLALKTGIWTFVIVFLISVLVSLTLGVDYSTIVPTPPNVLNINEIPEYLPYFINNAFITAIVFFIIRMIYPALFNEKSSSLMCDKCFQVKAFEKNRICECGGTYLPMESFKWKDDNTGNISSNEGWLNNFKIYKNEDNNS